MCFGSLVASSPLLTSAYTGGKARSQYLTVLISFLVRVLCYVVVMTMERMGESLRAAVAPHPIVLCCVCSHKRPYCWIRIWECVKDVWR